MPQAVNGQKLCTKCRVVKPVSAFTKDSRRKDGLFTWCGDCSRAHSLAKRNANLDEARRRSREWARKNRAENPEAARDAQRQYYEANKDKYLEYARKHREKYPVEYADRQRKGRLRRDFGMTMDEYEAMLEGQNGVCLLCHQPPTGRWLCVDHDHATGAVRGLLCQRCNRTLGLFEDDHEWFARASAYLNR